jgi:hypothetical protein
MKIGYRKGSDVSDDGIGFPLLFKDSIGVVYGAELNVQIPLILSLLPPPVLKSVMVSPSGLHTNLSFP